MLIGEFNNIKISGLSVAVPSNKVQVETYYDRFGEETVNKFIEMTGVHSVSRSVPEQTASDLGLEAANNLLNRSNVYRHNIGILVFVTQKPDYRVPSTAFVLHKRLNLSENCSCFDINLACSGFVYGLQTVISLLNCSNSKYALLITGDTSTKTISPDDRTMVMLFGVSGSATLLEKSESLNLISLAFRPDGDRFK